MKKTVLVVLAAIVAMAGPVAASTRLKNICRVKGQEEIELRGMGLVVGLNGTGEANDTLTMQAIGRAMEIMGNPVQNADRVKGLEDLKKIKNVALVMVSATVPATGARRGDKVDCFVSALNGKSLLGGRLAFASLQGPNVEDLRIYALCQGQVVIENPEQPMVGVIHGGSQIEADLLTPFYKDGYITIILDKNHADFQTASEIVYSIRKEFFGSKGTDENDKLVEAINASNIRVQIPQHFLTDPVAFTSELLDVRLEDPQTESRVVINPRAGTIVISGDVEIGDVIVSHKNVTVDASSEAPSFAAIDVDKSGEPKLQDLVNQLNSLKVPTADMIEIIKGIDRNGKLHGRLIVE